MKIKKISQLVCLIKNNEIFLYIVIGLLVIFIIIFDIVNLKTKYNIIFRVNVR